MDQYAGRIASSMVGVPLAGTLDVCWRVLVCWCALVHVGVGAGERGCNASHLIQQLPMQHRNQRIGQRQHLLKLLALLL